MNSAAEKIIARLDEIGELAEKRLLDSVSSIEEEILDALLKIVRKFNVGEVLKSNEASQAFLNAIDSEIERVLLKSGYYADVSNFLVNFDLIEANNRKLHKAVNNLTISSALTSPYKKLAINLTRDNLLSSGINSAFSRPIKDLLVRYVVLGTSLREAEIGLAQRVLSDKDKLGALRSYVSQVARDSISQYDGTIQTIIQQEYKLDNIAYLGSIVEGTRGQCYKWVEMGTIPVSKLQAEIDWVNARLGSTYSGRRISGWIDGTTVDTFLVNRGGWRCRHRGVAIRS